MRTTDQPEFSVGAAAMSASVDSLLEAKLSRPPTREDWVDRPRLVEQLERATKHPVALVAAPAGFGKTTLAAQWLASSRSGHTSAAWLTLDEDDNAPHRLWTHVATALERAGCPLGHDVATLVAGSSGVMTGVLPRLLNSMAAMADDVVLVLDDFHRVKAPACHDQVEFLIEHLPEQAHLMIISRADPGLRLGRLRAAAQLAEIRAADLAFTTDEASALLALQQIQVSWESLARLMDRTEGWPAGVYLATLSLVGRPDPDEFVAHFSGDDRFVGDYLTEEVLSRHTDRVRDFIVSISILDRFSPSLCDAVVEAPGSAAVLHELERTNMFLVPLDEKREWFRFHHLFAAVARSELALEHPERILLLHARAAQWFREHGHVDEAVTHLLAAGATGDAARLVHANWMRYVDAGRTATVLGWFPALGTPSLETDPGAAVTAAWLAGMSGDEPGLVELVESLESCLDYGPLPDGTRSVESAVAMIKGLFGYGGPVEMLAGARRAVELETDGRSPHYAIANLTLGHAAYVAGDLETASTSLAKASDNDAAPAITRVLSLSSRSLVEAERGHQQRSRVLAESAMEVAAAQGLDAMPEASMAFTALGQALASAGKVADAMATVQQGLELRRKDPAVAPWSTLHHLLTAASVAVLAGDQPMAQELLTESSRRMDRYPQGMGPMRSRLASVQEMMRSLQANTADGEPLTAREAEVLRLLQSPMSLTEIAAQLFVSPNTVKTHVQALYRKLGARSRTEAVRIARQRLLV